MNVLTSATTNLYWSYRSGVPMWSLCMTICMNMHITIVEKACATASMYAFYKDGCFHNSNLPMGICGEATMAGETGVTRPGVPGVHG